MDLIDERGRLFGRVNVIDASVLIGVAGLIVLGVVLVGSAPSGGEANTSADPPIRDAGGVRPSGVGRNPNRVRGRTANQR